MYNVLRSKSLRLFVEIHIHVYRLTLIQGPLRLSFKMHKPILIPTVIHTPLL